MPCRTSPTEKALLQILTTSRSATATDDRPCSSTQERAKFADSFVARHAAVRRWHQQPNLTLRCPDSGPVSAGVAPIAGHDAATTIMRVDVGWLLHCLKPRLRGDPRAVVRAFDPDGVQDSCEALPPFADCIDRYGTEALIDPDTTASFRPVRGQLGHRRRGIPRAYAIFGS